MPEHWTDARHTHSPPGQIVRSLWIIVSSMAAGVALFAAVILIFIPEREPTDADLTLSRIAFWSTLGIVWTGFAAVLVLRNRRLHAMRKSHAAGTMPQIPEFRLDDAATHTEIARQLLSLHLTCTILKCACYEGAALFCLVAYISDRWWVLIAIAALLVLGLLLTLPFRSRLERWINVLIGLVNQARPAAFNSPS